MKIRHYFFTVPCTMQHYALTSLLNTPTKTFTSKSLSRIVLYWLSDILAFTNQVKLSSFLSTRPHTVVLNSGKSVALIASSLWVHSWKEDNSKVLFCTCDGVFVYNTLCGFKTWWSSDFWTTKNKIRQLETNWSQFISQFWLQF